MSTPQTGPCPGPVETLVESYRTDPDLTPPSDVAVTVAFSTSQSARHSGRSSGYRNDVVSLRVGAATGSCAVEPGSIDPETVHACAGEAVAELLQHDEPAVRIAALDAYLTHRHPHAADPRAATVQVKQGDSLQRSLERARAVTSLVETPPGGKVLVIGVVNSLLACLRERGVEYVACDLTGGRTEWGDPIVTDFTEVLPGCDAVLASGMMLGNNTFDRLVECVAARDTQIPVTVFAQSGAAVARELLGFGVDALSAEPYPFFWLSGDPSPIYLYRAECSQ